MSGTDKATELYEALVASVLSLLNSKYRILVKVCGLTRCVAMCLKVLLLITVSLQPELRHVVCNKADTESAW